MEVVENTTFITSKHPCPAGFLKQFFASIFVRSAKSVVECTEFVIQTTEDRHTAKTGLAAPMWHKSHTNHFVMATGRATQERAAEDRRV